MKRPTSKIFSIADRTITKLKDGKPRALAWTSTGYQVLMVPTWEAMVANGRASSRDLVAIYSPGIDRLDIARDLLEH